MPSPTSDPPDFIALTAQIVSAFVSKNALPRAELHDLIQSVHAGLMKIASGAAPAEPPVPLTPAVTIRQSIKPDYLICLDDGKKFKSLRRHLTALGMTPQQYRTKWNLPADYPMVAANYAAQRSALAIKIGLGQRGRGGAVAKRKSRRPAKASA